MNYHIDTGLIYEKFGTRCACPLCEIEKIVEEQFLHEFLNDAVMEDNSRIAVGKKGFCAKHFDMLFSRQNKLSVALQIDTRIDNISDLFAPIKSAKKGAKLAERIDESFSTCVICDLVKESMEKYYKTIAQMFTHEKEFYKTLIKYDGVCLKHYAELLRFAKYAGKMADYYVEILSATQNRAFAAVKENLKEFCVKHDYRNALKPLGSAENALPDARLKIYGKKPE